ncbi:hypothetical protein ACU4GD_08120 [Cupriavidus basilensis]
MQWAAMNSVMPKGLRASRTRAAATVFSRWCRCWRIGLRVTIARRTGGRTPPGCWLWRGGRGLPAGVPAPWASFTLLSALVFPPGSSGGEQFGKAARRAWPGLLNRAGHAAPARTARGLSPRHAVLAQGLASRSSSGTVVRKSGAGSRVERFHQ